MLANRAWVQRNLGFDPIANPPPPATFSVAAAAHPRGTPEDLQREIIEFDSEAPEGREFLAFSTATGLSRFTDIPWPAGLAPKTGPKPHGTGAGPLPRADVLVVTWTVDEGHALSRVLTPGKDSRNDYVPYTHNFAAISAKMRAGCPALQAGRLGTFWTTTVGGTSAVVFKSDSHLSQDVKRVPAAGGTLPNFDVWQQIIAEVRPKLVITTGTAGGIGRQWQVGDVVVSPVVRFDGTHWLKTAAFHNAVFTSEAPKRTRFATARRLFAANAGQLPPANTRPPLIRVSKRSATSVLTTDFFGFDTSDDHFHLQGLGSVSEMGDAILGLVASQMADPPRWVAVRNVSDPQIEAAGSIRDQARIAAQIYKGFGRWSTVCSALVCWALMAAE